MTYDLQSPPRPQYIPLHPTLKPLRKIPAEPETTRPSSPKRGIIQLDLAEVKFVLLSFPVIFPDLQVCDRTSFRPSIIMKVARIVLPRGFPTPRVLRRPQLSAVRDILAGRCVRTNTTSSRDGSQHPENSSWSPGRTLLMSALAAGLGYGYASYAQTPQTTRKPRYGSTGDFEKVFYLLNPCK